MPNDFSKTKKSFGYAPEEINRGIMKAVGEEATPSNKLGISDGSEAYQTEYNPEQEDRYLRIRQALTGGDSMNPLLEQEKLQRQMQQVPQPSEFDKQLELQQLDRNKQQEMIRNLLKQTGQKY